MTEQSAEQTTAVVPDPGIGQQASTPGQSPDWHESIADESLKAFIAGKGFKDAGEAAKALHDLEGKTAIPESADAYKLPVPVGQDIAFATEAARWMQEAGVPVAQAQLLAAKWNAYQAAQTAAFEQRRYGRARPQPVHRPLLASSTN